MSYGGFNGGDPRRFHPDPEMCSPEETENHRLACEAWNRGDPQEVTTVINGIHDGVPFHATVRPFGIGVTEEPAEAEEDAWEPDVALEDQDDEELLEVYLSNAGTDSDYAMAVLADRHGLDISYEDDEPPSTEENQ